MAIFSDVFVDVTRYGTKIPQEDYLSEGLYQIIDQGQNEIAGYSNNPDGLFTDVPAIIFGDHTRVFKYVDKPLFLGADGVKLLKAKGDNTNYKYLYYALCSVRIPDTGYNRHFKWLKEAEIPLPDTTAQAKIVAVLDKVNALITSHKRQLAKLDELVKVRFVELFGSIHENVVFPYQPIGTFTSVVSGGTPNRDIPEYWENGTIPWVKTTELKNEPITMTEEQITEEGLKESSAKLVPAGTVLVAMYGQGKTRGMTGYLAIESSTNQACACILPSNSINQQYLWQYLILSYDRLRDMAKGGNQPNLSGSVIKNFPVLFPPKKMQDAFVEYIEKIREVRLTIRQGLDKMETLKRALMQEYFGGSESYDEG